MDVISRPETITLAILVLIVLGVGIRSAAASASSAQQRVRMLWRIEAKLDLVLKQAGLEFDPYKNVPAGVAEALQRGEKIRAIKYYREATGVGLKEAKDFIEEFQRRAAG